jgi:hypothetical protein
MKKIQMFNAKVAANFGGRDLCLYTESAIHTEFSVGPVDLEAGLYTPSLA